MIDQRLYCETFSRLCASEDAKKEVFLKMEHQRQRKKGLLRGAVIAAAMTMALAVTAGAVNLATGGVLLQSLREVWSDGCVTRYEGVDLDGNSVQVSVSQGSTIHMTEEGRMLLRSAGEEVDITREMTQDGEARFEKTMEQRTVEVLVTGTVEEWELMETVTEADGTVYRSSFTKDSMPGEITVSGVTVETEGRENGAFHRSAAIDANGGEELEPRDAAAVESLPSAEVVGP